MRWCLLKDSGVFVIRRWNCGKYERMPVSKYRHIRNDEALLAEFVLRLNAPLDVKEAVNFRHAFINDALLEDYKEWLLARFPTRQTDARCEFHYLKKHFLDYFIAKLDIKDPSKWESVAETKWAKYLLSPDVPRGTTTKKHIILAANRFLRWLHKRRPTEVPAMHLRPLTSAVFKEWDQQRKIDKTYKVRTFITDAHWAAICKNLPATLAPFVYLSAYYGLRRSETLGLTNGAVRKGHLAVEKQLLAAPEGGEPQFKPLKGRDNREVPHWFATAAQAYEWVVQVQEHRVHPRTLTERWINYMERLGKLPYDFHDLRHTFATNAMIKYPPREVQLACGHKNIETTMRYAHKKPRDDNEEFKPAS